MDCYISYRVTFQRIDESINVWAVLWERTRNRPDAFAHKQGGLPIMTIDLTDSALKELSHKDLSDRIDGLDDLLADVSKALETACTEQDNRARD